MGFVKRWQEDLAAVGLTSLSWEGAEQAVGSCCIGDEALATFVARHGPIATCSFCHATSCMGTTIEVLFKYVSGCLDAEWEDPIQSMAWSGQDGGWIGADVIDSDELLRRVDEPFAHPELREWFVAATDHEWCAYNPYALPHDERLLLSWRRFTHSVIHERRFGLARAEGRHALDDLIEPSRMLEELAKAIHNVAHHLLRRLAAGTRLLRGRAHEATETPTTATELGSPPPVFAGATRMSPEGISVFYAAEDLDTVHWEMRPGPQQSVTIAEWITMKEIPFLDLADLPPVPSLFDMTGRRERPWLAFLRPFASEIAQPVESGNALGYVPTQIVTEYVRDHLLDNHGDRLLGIRYRSAMRPGGVCWVIFAGPSRCTEAANATDQTVLGLDPMSVTQWPPDRLDP